jgi:uncharacterized protein YdeI (BOF family)
MRSFSFVSTIALGALISGHALGQESTGSDQQSTQQNTTNRQDSTGSGQQATANPQPYAKSDDSWISISGTVASPEPDSFSLDYGDGVITVEMDDWDTYGDAYPLMEGDRVTVYGTVDDDLFELSSIEASSVYVEGLGTYFYASSADEEDPVYAEYFWTAPTPLVLNRATLRGTVERVDREDREFTIDSGLQQVTVETDALDYNPLDDFGFQKIERGDKVSVSGEFDVDFLQGRVFEAESVITLSDANRSSTGSS